ncbi:MAG: alginate export family protein [Candidatus Omnitrophota bacterium]|nr:alginate export family protein [Candidatus Omnitrophota bacterium]
MRKTPFLAVFFVLSLVGVPAFAAVENVKVSGDINVRGIYKDSYSLGAIKGNDTFNGTKFNPTDETQRFVMSTMRLRVDADLTGNISGEVELLNQRDWDPPSGAANGSGLTTATNIGPGAAGGSSAANDQFDVILNLANITIKELYYPELSVTIGRQNLHWGDGFVLGDNQLGNPDPSGTISADEFSLFNSFDAVRFYVEKGDWHFDAFAAKIAELGINNGDDHNAFGINVGRAFSAYDAEGEMYFLGDRDAARLNGTGDTFAKTEEIWTIGTRGGIKPWDRMRLNGEFAFQWGEEGGASGQANSPPTTSTLARFTLNGDNRQNIRAFAYDLRAEWDWIESPWPMTLGAEWVFYSGEEISERGKSGAWRPLYRGKFHSAIREFQGQFYLTDPDVTPGFTNQHQLMVDVLFHPFNNPDLGLFGRWLMYWLDESVIEGRGRFIGNELDMVLTYDYTEDLQFKMIGGIFMPGDYFHTDASVLTSAGQSVTTADENAKILTAEVTLAF